MVFFMKCWAMVFFSVVISQGDFTPVHVAIVVLAVLSIVSDISEAVRDYLKTYNETKNNMLKRGDL